jgi:hypothetical protein
VEGNKETLEEIVITSKDTKDARHAAASLGGMKQMPLLPKTARLKPHNKKRKGWDQLKRKD